MRRKLAGRLGTKSVVHQQQRAQYESQLLNVYSSRHEHALESVYFNILEKQYRNHQGLFSKQQLILDSLAQQTHFCQLIEGLLDHRSSIIGRTSEQMKKIIYYIKTIVNQSQSSAPAEDVKQPKADLHTDVHLSNLIERIKHIENDFSKK
jgi:hypothetical protein